jgi:hypothetical protein
MQFAGIHRRRDDESMQMFGVSAGSILRRLSELEYEPVENLFDSNDGHGIRQFERRNAFSPIPEGVQSIKQRMIGLLTKSAKATEELCSELKVNASNDNSLDARARAAVERLVAGIQFSEGASALVAVHERCESDVRRLVGELAEDFACVLVDESDLSCFQMVASGSSLGAFVTVPTTNETLVEILLARQAGKRPVFAMGEKWPRGISAIPRPPLRNDPYNDSEILDKFQSFMEDKYLTPLEKKKHRDNHALRRQLCNERHLVELGARKRQRYFLLDDLDDHQRVLDRLREDWPSVAFIEMGENSRSPNYNLLQLLRTLFNRKAEDDL